MNKLFFQQVAEQTIYFSLFAEQSFFHKYYVIKIINIFMHISDFDFWYLGNK